MKNFLVFVAVFFSACAAVGAESSHDVLAHSSGDWAWFAHVGKSVANNASETPVSNEQTEIYARHNGPGERWRSLPTLTGRAVSLASRSSQLAVLMSDGQWLTLWGDDSATGQPLPGTGRIKTFADDGQTLWCIGSVPGGIKAANEALIAEAASTRPTTNASVPAPTSAPATSPAKSLLVLFKQIDGRWATVSELPAEELMASEDDISLAIVNGAPMLTFRAPGGPLRTLRYSIDHNWQFAGAAKAPDSKTVLNFRLFSDGFKPFVWLTTGDGAGELFSITPAEASSPSHRLDWTSPLKLSGIPTATFAGGYVCIFGPQDEKKVLEQRYSIAGTPFESAAELTVPETREGMVPHWLEVVVLAILGFSVGAYVFRHWSMGDQPPAGEAPVPAALLYRLAGGLIDAIPVILALIYTFATTSLTQADLMRDQPGMPAIKTLIVLGIGILIYLLHTTISELLTGRSVGKRVMGLKVVTIDGLPPTRAQFLIRNLLRLIDPLVMILFSPLRQRSADTVANTMVVGLQSKPSTSTEEITEPGADKTGPR